MNIYIVKNTNRKHRNPTNKQHPVETISRSEVCFQPKKSSVMVDELIVLEHPPKHGAVVQ